MAQNIDFHNVHTGLTGGKFVQTEVAVSLLQLNSDTTPKLDISVPLPWVHFVLLMQTNKQTSKSNLNSFLGFMFI